MTAWLDSPLDSTEDMDFQTAVDLAVRIHQDGWHVETIACRDERGRLGGWRVAFLGNCFDSRVHTVRSVRAWEQWQATYGKEQP